MQSRKDGMPGRANEGLGHVHVTLFNYHLVITVIKSFNEASRYSSPREDPKTVT
jgi:hypothetical protein